MDPFESAEKKKGKRLPTLLVVALLGFVLMLLFGLLTRTWFPANRPWGSEIITAIFGGVLAIAAARFVLQGKKGRNQSPPGLEREFRRMFDGSPMGIALLGLDGGAILCNEALQRMLGYSEPELRGKRIMEFAYPKESALENISVRRLMEEHGGRYQKESRYRCRNGEVISVRLNMSLIRGEAGRPQSVLAIVENVTERRQAQQQLRQLSRAVEQSPVSIVITDKSGHIEYVNSKFTEVTGYSLEEVVGKNPRILKSGEMPLAGYEALWRTIVSGREWRGELHNRKKNGELFWESASISPVWDEDGRIDHFVAVKEDITERKKLEAQFLRSQRMESLGTLAGGIAHDLNNVLTPILISVQVLKERTTDAHGRRLLDTLDANVQRATNLVKQVLTFGRGVQGERVLFEPAQVVRELGQIIRQTFPKSVTFESNCATDLWNITGDPTQLHQVLLNLCVNARDAMPRGGRLSVQVENAVLDQVDSPMNPKSKPGPFVVIGVRDTGVGIPKEIMDRIFEPFFTTKRPGNGTGLGLSTSLGIVKSHGGFIHCYSDFGRGSLFKVYLPATTKPVKEDHSIAPSRSPQGHGELILLVDDEQSIRDVAQKMLEQFGYRVLLAAHGEEAVSIYGPRKDEIALVITDMAMPVMDGPATILALKQINPGVRIIASSGLGLDAGMAPEAASAVRHFIPKPYTTDTMLQALAKVLHQTAC